VGDDVLEPVELEPLDVEDQPLPPREPLHIRPSWVAVIAAVVVAWIVIAVVTRDDHRKPTAPTTPTTAARNTFPASRPADLVVALKGVGSGRFAAVINSELFILNTNTGTRERVDLPPGPLWIESQNGSSLLVRKNRAYYLIGTVPISVVALPLSVPPIATLDRDHWWVVSPSQGGILRRDGDGPIQGVPAGVRLLAAVDDGFLATSRDSFVVWDGWTVRPLSIHGSFFDATSRVVALGTNCPGLACVVDVTDLQRGGSTRLSAANADRAKLSPDGSRLAVASERSQYVTMVDVTMGLTRSVLPRRKSPPMVAPLAWTPTGDALLVLTDSNISVVRASDGMTERTIDDGGSVQQIVALP
jgi:hypothetical protein